MGEESDVTESTVWGMSWCQRGLAEVEHLDDRNALSFQPDMPALGFTRARTTQDLRTISTQPLLDRLPTPISY